MMKMEFRKSCFYFIVALFLAGATTQVKGQVKTITLPGGVDMQFALIPAGEFLMGSPETAPDRDPDEGPAHQVKISLPFYLGTTEVTQRQWKALMGNNPAVFKVFPEHLEHPVEMVSWNDCQRFIEKLNTLGLGKFRLPTEAEWEYACRAGTTTRYFWGDESKGIREHCWYNRTSYARTYPVGTKKQNPWGLYDMAGSVWEWCSDWKAPYPAEGLRVDPKGPVSGKVKIFRGGSWYDFENSLRAANRHGHGTDKGYSAIGLRVLMEVP